MKYVLKFFKGIWTTINVFRRIVLNLLFLFLFFAFIAAIGNQPSRPTVIPDGAALVLKLEGELVEVQTPPSLDAALTGGPVPQTELRPLLKTLEQAADDDYVKALMLDLSTFTGGGFTKLADLAAALDTFRESGKPVYVYGDNFTQGQYLLAAHADEVMMNPLGVVDLTGFGSWQPFFAEALEKLNVDIHVFRVGEFKAAVEPYLLSNMSEEAKANIGGVLNDAWQAYMQDLMESRDLDPQTMDTYVNAPHEMLARYQGDTALAALEAGLIDRITDRTEASEFLKEQLGIDEDTDSWPRISLEDYRFIKNNPLMNRRNTDGDKVGLIMAAGEIVDGKGGSGTIGGDTLAALVRKARDDEEVKALVLRVDSPGGSAFASEIIRSELEHFTASGRPLIISMGSLAASGGYWISTPAEEIWASPATITGSIGIYGMIPTFDRALEKLGVNIDGVGTTDFSGALVTGEPLPPEMAEAIQYNVNRGYDLFLQLVSDSRNMSREEVDEVARGQVWSGQKAQELGLVDQLGDLDEALASAAEKAGLEDWREYPITRTLSPFEQLLKDLSNNMQSTALFNRLQAMMPQTPNTLLKLADEASAPLEELLQRSMNPDPTNTFAHCLECNFDLR